MSNFMFGEGGLEHGVPLQSVDSSLPEWKILLVDDEDDVHKVTRLVLDSFIFDGRKIKIFNAYSGKEGYQLLLEHPDMALALIDVVMESDHAGLHLVKRIRDELRNTNIRLVLRTGQPGQAPEKKVISDYDINDYKNKTELTDTKLHTLMYAALRSYRDIVTLENNRKGLEEVIKSSAYIFEISNLSQFASAVLSQLINLLGSSGDAAHLRLLSGVAVESGGTEFTVKAGVGRYADIVGDKLPVDLHGEIGENLFIALSEERNIYTEHEVIAYFGREEYSKNLLYIKGVADLHATDRYLIDLFCSNVSIAFDNACLQKEIEDTQSEVIYLLGEAVENRSNETGYHVKRVAESSALLARKYGLTDRLANIVLWASPLHDLGKIGIPDSVLNKPGKHNEQERVMMREHVEIGYSMLKRSRREVLRCAAIIAGQHHERWDGDGYPQGLKGEEIHVFGRITAVADVFDALLNSRCYKPAWELNKVLALFEDEKGKHFDPQLVDILINNIDDFMSIQRKFQNPSP